MEDRIRRIREYSGNKVSFAIGCQIEDDCRNVRTALRIADEKMYEDKRKYYEKKRRNEAARTHPADSGNAGDKG